MSQGTWLDVCWSDPIDYFFVGAYFTGFLNKCSAIPSGNKGMFPLRIFLFPLDVGFQNLLSVTQETR